MHDVLPSPQCVFGTSLTSRVRAGFDTTRKEKKKKTLGSQVKYNPFPSFPPKSKYSPPSPPSGTLCTLGGRESAIYFGLPPFFPARFLRMFFIGTRNLLFREKGGEKMWAKQGGGELSSLLFSVCTYVKQSPLAKPFARKRGAAERVKAERGGLSSRMYIAREEEGDSPKVHKTRQ